MKTDYDVVIVGAGIAGTILGSILAKNNVKTLIIDSGSHPKFSIGESMIPETNYMLKILSKEFDFPELEFMTNPDAIVNNISTSAAGIKLSFSFAWHQEGKFLNPENIVSPPLLAPESHLFRQDVDAFYLSLAAKNGVDLKQFNRIGDVTLNNDEIKVRVNESQWISAKYIVDAAGFRSPLAEKFSLREDCSTMMTNTSSIFTHMTGVQRYEDIMSGEIDKKCPVMLSQTTLHHIFPECWLWIIPFDNHPFSTNKLCSVGLQYNNVIHGDIGDPEKEFLSFLKRYPSVAKHFTEAKRVREWTKAPRINYSSREVLGERYCLLGHAAGFVDPLFSRGLSITFESICRIAPLLIAAQRKDSWTCQQFSTYKNYLMQAIAINDRLVANSYTAFRSFDLWNAWHRVWIAGSYLANLRLSKILQMYDTKSNNASVIDFFNEEPYPGNLSRFHSVYEELFECSCEKMEELLYGKVQAEEVIEMIRVFFIRNRSYFPAMVDFENLDNHYIAIPTQGFVNRLTDWANSSPLDIRCYIDGQRYRNVNFLDKYRFSNRLVESEKQSRLFSH